MQIWGKYEREKPNKAAEPERKCYLFRERMKSRQGQQLRTRVLFHPLELHRCNCPQIIRAERKNRPAENNPGNIYEPAQTEEPQDKKRTPGGYITR